MDKHLNTGRRLTVPETHQLKIAKKTMKMNCVGALVLGGPNHYEAANIIHELTGAIVAIDSPCSCQRI